jgi:excisionase family DNA binding protein
VSTALVRKLIKQGKIPSIRLGRVIRVPRVALAASWETDQFERAS